MRLDQTVEPHLLAGGEDLAVGGEGQSECDVFLERALDQAHVLGEVADLLAQQVGGEVLDVDLTKEHAPGGREVEARENL